MVTQIPDAFVFACIASATLNVVLITIIALIAHSRGEYKGRFIQSEQGRKVVPMKKDAQ